MSISCKILNVCILSVNYYLKTYKVLGRGWHLNNWRSLWFIPKFSTPQNLKSSCAHNATLFLILHTHKNKKNQFLLTSNFVLMYSCRQVPPFKWLLCCRNGTQEQLSYTETLTSSNRQVNTSLLRNATVHMHSVVRAPVLDRMGISTEKNSYADSLL